MLPAPELPLGAVRAPDYDPLLLVAASQAIAAHLVHGSTLPGMDERAGLIMSMLVIGWLFWLDWKRNGAP